MIHIHPFPARMAPDVALQAMNELRPGSSVLDPMSGSGMVIGTASKLGLAAYGYDLDPLACLISRVNGTAINVEKVEQACDLLLSAAESADANESSLPWVDTETLEYIEFWFGNDQRLQLSKLSYLLHVEPIVKNKAVLDLLKVTLSRLIVTKEPKASLARDTAHSRPHRTITNNEFDVLAAMRGSLRHVLKALRPEEIRINAKTYRGDARRMGRVRDRSVDRIITSPPYLNAIDYMRGHRLSLVWLGFSIAELRKIRSRSVGAEIAGDHRVSTVMRSILDELPDEVDSRKRRMLTKYHRDLSSSLSEAFRVLRPGCQATYVMGNSNIKGHEIKNSEILIDAAKNAGFRLSSRSMREIPENRRYMPLVNSIGSPLSKRMRSEHIVTFDKD